MDASAFWPVAVSFDRSRTMNSRVDLAIPRCLLVFPRKFEVGSMHPFSVA